MVDSHAVLVVDDERLALRATVATLEKAGYLVFRAVSGAAALRQARARHPSLVLLDTTLPDLSAMEVLRRIRVDSTLEAVSVVMLGAHVVTQEQQVLALESGADDFIVRPVSNAELLARVRARLRQRGRIEPYQISETRVRTVFEHQVDAVVVVDVLGVITYANPAAGGLFGRDSRDLIGAPFGFPLTGHNADVQLLDIPRRDRPPAMAEMRVTPIQWEGRNAWIATLCDITARRAAERAVRESKALLDMATNVARLGAWSFDVVTGKTVWSDSTREILDVPPDATPPLPGMLDLVVPEHGLATRRFFEACVHDGTPFDFETKVTTLTGRCIHIRSLGAAVRDEENRIARVQGAFQDITDVKLAEQRIARSERRFREMTEAMPMIVWTATPDGAVDYINRQFFEYTGISSAEAPTGCWRQAVPLSDLRRATRRWIQALATGDTFETEFRLRRGHDQRYRWYFLRAVAIRDEAGAIVKWYGTGMDVHAARLLQEEARHLNRRLMLARDEAEQANQAKSRFLANITHELRTPLHGILGYAELLYLEGGLKQTQLERVDAMMTAGNYLLETINAVLDMSQIEADQLELHQIEIEITDLIRSCVEVVRPKAEAKRLALTIAPAAPLRIFADPLRLRQVLLNLLGNAVKFTPAGVVEIRLQQTESGDCVRLAVADTGPGIWAKHRDKLFNAFERLNAKAVSGIEGSGLGLAIAARLVQLMDGRIGYADNPGGGSVFWVELPLAAVPAAEGEAAKLSPSAGRPRLQVLVVDDEAMNRSIASGFLRMVGHDVVCVDNGEAAVEAAATADFDAVLMDVRMPGMDGLEATRLIRALPGSRGKVAVVGVTAQAFTQQIETCRQAGMNYHLIKPFKQAVLLAALESVTAAPNDTEVPVVPPTALPDDTATEFPILDRAAFNDIAAILSVGELETNLKRLITCCEALLSGLRDPEMLLQARALAEAAHKLAGGAVMLGFLHVTAAARRFEVAADTAAPEAETLGDHLAAAIEASVAVARQEISLIASNGI